MKSIARNGKSTDFHSKKQQLENIKEQLKKEFFGIDRVIDQVVDNMSSWYLFPQFQDLPVVINLWGMTGVGKTSLVSRLITLLEMEDFSDFESLIEFSHHLFHDPEGELHEEGWHLMQKARKVALEVLEWQEPLLKALAYRLFKDRELSRDALAKIMDEHGLDPEGFQGSIAPPWRYAYEEIFRNWVG